MLSVPKAGWTTFKINDSNEYMLSYLTDVPFDWLTHAIHGLETMDVFAVHGNCEPGRMVCTISHWSCYVLFEDEDPNPKCDCFSQINLSMIDFCRNLYTDILNYLDAWVHWDEYSLTADLEIGDETGYNSVVQERRTILLNKLDRLLQLIDEKEHYFREDYLFF
ncbi:MAG: hypothetical protein IJM45_10960 [Clostridia bacterium]|nr:hypothetical protein [Clostridia bacterium]